MAGLGYLNTYRRHKKQDVHVRRLTLDSNAISQSYIEDDGAGNLKFFNAAGTGASLNATALATIDGVTAGTVTARKALVVDANRDLSTVHNLSIDGNFVTGAVTLSAAELGVLDAVTPGTAGASLAVVLDANKAIAGITESPLAKTADYTVQVGDSGRHITNTGAAGTIILTLPSVATSTGVRLWVHVVVDQAVTVTAPAGTLVGPNNAGRTSYTSGVSGQRIGTHYSLFCDGAKWHIAVTLNGLTLGAFS